MHTEAQKIIYAMRYRCGMCGEMYHPEDFPDPGFYPLADKRIEWEHMADRICNGCADELRSCSVCGAIEKPESFVDFAQDEMGCHSCEDEWHEHIHDALVRMEEEREE